MTHRRKLPGIVAAFFLMGAPGIYAGELPSEGPVQVQVVIEEGHKSDHHEESHHGDGVHGSISLITMSNDHDGGAITLGLKKGIVGVHLEAEGVKTSDGDSVEDFIHGEVSFDVKNVDWLTPVVGYERMRFREHGHHEVDYSHKYSYAGVQSTLHPLSAVAHLIPGTSIAVDWLEVEAGASVGHVRESEKEGHHGSHVDSESGYSYNYGIKVSDIFGWLNLYTGKSTIKSDNTVFHSFTTEATVHPCERCSLSLSDNKDEYTDGTVQKYRVLTFTLDL